MRLPYASSLQQVNSKRVSDFILEQLEEAIILKEFLSDEQLPSERELASLLKTSRLAVREAIAELEKAGLVARRIGAKGGTFVLPLTAHSHERTREEIRAHWPEVRDVFEYRSIIEPEAARLAAKRMDGESLAQLRQLVTDSIDPACTRERFRALDVRFHLLIADSAHNTHITKAVRRIRTKINPALDLLPFSREIRTTSYDEHLALLDALQSRDGDQASKIMKAHIDQTVNRVHDKVFGAPAAGEATPHSLHPE